MFILVHVLRFENPNEASEYADENISEWNKIIQYEDDNPIPYVVECHSYFGQSLTLH